MPGWWSHDANDLLAIQVCHGKAEITHGDRAKDTVVESQYQLKLVFRGSPPTRRNLSEQAHLSWTRKAARQITEFADKPVLDYVGEVGTEAVADAEARRLLTEAD